MDGCVRQERPNYTGGRIIHQLELAQRPHELGHFYLHVKQHAHCHCTHVSIDPQSSDGAVLVTAPGIEREADSFAAALLMPQDLLRGHVTRFGRCVAFLAARYRVSQPAMRRRLRQLGLEG